VLGIGRKRYDVVTGSIDDRAKARSWGTVRSPCSSVEVVQSTGATVVPYFILPISLSSDGQVFLDPREFSQSRGLHQEGTAASSVLKRS
jgi:hypothetical protein